MLRFLLVAALLSCVLCQRGGRDGERGSGSETRERTTTPKRDAEAFEKLAEFLDRDFPTHYAIAEDDVVALREALHRSPSEFYAVATLFLQHHMGQGKLGVYMRELCEMVSRILDNHGINFHFYECLLDNVCDDGVPCTEDSCSHNMCINKPIKGCTPCQNADQCDDGNACTADMCSDDNMCRHYRAEGCESCHFDYDCKDDKTCTDDFCDAGRCQHVRAPQCTESPMDCADKLGMVFCPMDSICREDCSECGTYNHHLNGMCVSSCWAVGLFNCPLTDECVDDCGACGIDFTKDYDYSECVRASPETCKKNAQFYCPSADCCMDDCDACADYPQTTDMATCQAPCYHMEEGDDMYCHDGYACQYDKEDMEHTGELSCQYYSCYDHHEGETCYDHHSPEGVAKCHRQEGKKLMTCEPGCGSYYCESCGRYVDDCCWDCDGSVKDDDTCTCRKGSDVWMDLISNPDLSTFTSLAQLVYGSTKKLPRCGVTIFAPTNEAFDRLPEATGILNRPELRESLVKLHIVDNSLRYGDLLGAASGETLLQEPKQQNLGFVRKDGMVCVTGPYFSLGLDSRFDEVLAAQNKPQANMPMSPGRYNLAYIVGDEGWEAGNGIAYPISSVLLPALCKEVEATQTSIWEKKRPSMAYCEPFLPLTMDYECKYDVEEGVGSNTNIQFYATPANRFWSSKEFNECAYRCWSLTQRIDDDDGPPMEDQDDIGPPPPYAAVVVGGTGFPGCDRCIKVCQPTETFAQRWAGDLWEPPTPTA